MSLKSIFVPNLNNLSFKSLMSNEYPKLRFNIEIFPLEAEGQRFICLRDRENFSSKTLFLPFPMFFMVKDIIAPHLDLRFSGPCFAWAYKELAQSPPPEVFIIFGTAHAATQNLFTLTQKDFETPLGIVKTDKEFIQDLISRYDYDLFADEMTHRTEHTIEFQLLFLQYLYQKTGAKKIKIVPVLCGYFHEMILSGISPREVSQVADFIRAMEATMKERDIPICLISSADLAHVGLRYGDPYPVSPAYLQTLSREDLNFLEYAAKNDPEDLLQSIRKDFDRRDVYVAFHPFILC